MAKKVVTISDLLQCIASSCLVHRPPGGHALDDCDCGSEEGEVDRSQVEKAVAVEKDEAGEEEKAVAEEKDEAGEEEKGFRIREEDGGHRVDAAPEDSHKVRVRETEAFVHEVFDAVIAVKRAYVGLQEAHSPWDLDEVRKADAAVVVELRKLGRLRDRFRRECFTPPATAQTAALLKHSVAPYEAVIDDLKRQLKAKEAEAESLKEKLRNSIALGHSVSKGRHHSSDRLGHASAIGPPGTPKPAPELFEMCMCRVKSASKSFIAHLLSLMYSSHWDVTAAVRSVTEGDSDAAEDHALSIPNLEPRHAKYALESYVNRKVFHGFENETFYLEGSLSSLIKPAEFRRDCFAQFRDMRGMEPEQLLGILPGCPFGRFAAAKYLAIVHANTEESLFRGMSEQRRQVIAGAHPRTEFYREFLRLAKAVWLLHLLAFGMDPLPAHFEAAPGAEFHPHYMESVARYPGGRVPAGSVVGFPVSPGFKLPDGSVVRTRVYLVPGA